jgi:C_GCAxxG_C_C family probable redox protein
VVCTYYDYTGMDEETLRNVGNAFAAGMGNMDGTCGALVGAGIVLGLATKDKAKSIKGMRQIMDKFKQRNGATQCKLLKGVGTGKVLRECPLCVADASEFLEEILEKEGCRK